MRTGLSSHSRSPGDAPAPFPHPAVLSRGRTCQRPVTIWTATASCHERERERKPHRPVLSAQEQGPGWNKSPRSAQASHGGQVQTSLCPQPCSHRSKASTRQPLPTSRPRRASPGLHSLSPISGVRSQCAQPQGRATGQSHGAQPQGSQHEPQM